DPTSNLGSPRSRPDRFRPMPDVSSNNSTMLSVSARGAAGRPTNSSLGSRGLALALVRARRVGVPDVAQPTPIERRISASGDHQLAVRPLLDEPPRVEDEHPLRALGRRQPMC